MKGTVKTRTEAQKQETRMRENTHLNRSGIKGRVKKAATGVLTAAALVCALAFGSFPGTVFGGIANGLSQILPEDAAAPFTMAAKELQPLTAHAADYLLFVCGTQVNDSNKSSLAGGAASYDETTNTLTLHGDIAYSSGAIISYYESGDLTITGSGTLDNTGSSVDNGAIDCMTPGGNLIINGTGAGITVKGASNGIRNLGGAVTISGAVKVSGNGWGIASAPVSITGGNVEVTSSGAAIFSLSDSISISGGTVTATGTGAGGIGIMSGTGNVTISGGDVTATGSAFYGIYARGNVSVTGASTKVTATGGQCGIFSYNGSIALDGTVTAKATDGSTNYGIYGKTGVSIAASAVKIDATSDAGASNSAVHSPDGTISISSPLVITTPTGGTLGSNSRHVYASDGSTVATHAVIEPGVTVTFDVQGHGTAPAQQAVASGATTTEPTAPTAAGYTFGGWYKEAGCTNSWDFSSDTVTAATTLYAKWTANSYTIHFDENGGTGTMADQSRTYDDGTALTTNAFTHPDGYPFTGWNTESDGSGDAYADGATDNLTNADGTTITLYAMWDIPQITTNSLPNGTMGKTYHQTLAATGVTAPLTWSIASGALPDGLALDSDTGVISGTPAVTGTFTITVQVEDSATPANTVTKALTITVRSTSAAASEKKSEHRHSYEWEVRREATEDDDGEMVYRCTGCGKVEYRVTLSAYHVFSRNLMEQIERAAQGATIETETTRWISFPRMIMQALADRPDVTLVVHFLDGGYKGARMTLTIPAGTDTLSLLDENGYAGFLYLGAKLGITAEE